MEKAPEPSKLPWIVRNLDQILGPAYLFGLVERVDDGEVKRRRFNVGKKVKEIQK